MSDDKQDLVVDLTTHEEKAIIKGKTSVPFQRLVNLILQRKVFGLFKNWGNEPIILDSDLLTDLASAPQDSQDNHRHLVMVTLGIGILTGIFFFALVEFILSFFGTGLTSVHYQLILIIFTILVLLFSILARAQKTNRSEKLVEALERAAGFLKK